MTTHQDTSAERKFERALKNVSGNLVKEVHDNIMDAFRAALASRDKAAQQPQGQSQSERLRDAGFTARDDRLTCDECGKKYTAQMLPMHRCEPQGQAVSEHDKRYCRHPSTEKVRNSIVGEQLAGFDQVGDLERIEAAMASRTTGARGEA